MANCFRSVSSRLCCTNYLKAANVIYAENTLGLRQTPQQVSENWTCSSTRNENLVARCKPFYLSNIYCKRNSINSCASLKVSLRHSGARCRQGSTVQVLQSGAAAHESACLAYSNSGNDGKVTQNPESENSEQGRPSVEQLEHIFKELSDHLPSILSTPLPISAYHPKIVLENNFRKKHTVGLHKYVYQLALVKMLVHWKFAYVRVQILKMTKHPEDGTIKVRWRVVGIPGMSVIFQFWKYNIFKLAKNQEEAPTWIDGFSIYYVGNDGKIVKHVLDKMQPDDDRVSANPKSTIAPKAVMFMGIVPESSPHDEAITCVVNGTNKSNSSYSTNVVKGVPLVLSDI